MTILKPTSIKLHYLKVINGVISSLILMLGAASASAPRAPISLTLSADQKTLYVAESSGASIAVVDAEKNEVLRRISIPGEASGVTLAGDQLLVTTPNNFGELLIVDPSTGKILHTIKVGQGARAPIVDRQLKRAYVCNYFMNSISVVDLTTHKEISSIPVLRMPTSAKLSKDEKTLYVANLLPHGPSNGEQVAAKVSLIDTATSKVTQHIELANGSNALRDLALTKDGRYLYVTHNLARFLVPTTQLDRGWINTNAMSIIDTQAKNIFATILLDDISQGAAAPWGIDLSPNQKHLYVAHSGTHEVSIISTDALMKKIEAIEMKEDLEYNLSIMSEIRERIKLPGNGPRAILAVDKGVYTAQFFSDDLSLVDLTNRSSPIINNLKMTPNLKLSQEREGEIIFNDATHCFQQWQSCNACHTEHGRVDGLNWDLLNDGIGNSKNAKSLLFAHVTPPAMITGIRASAEVAVRAGVKHILFAQMSDEKYEAIDAYLKSLKPEPSPYLINGKLSPSAERGERLFKSPSKGGCIICHNGPYYTDLKKHDIQNASPADRTSTWDTPTLREVWRSAPYLHDGRSATIQDVLIKENHGNAAKKLSPEDIKDLTEYVLSL